MAIFPQLVGVFLAALLLASLIFSVVRIFLTTGLLEVAHIATALLIVLGAVAVTMTLRNPAVFIGSALAFSAAVALLLEKGWNRVLPLIAVLFAAALMTGLPFTGI
ncbi:hypothetical protein [Brevirhabdus sp.]|uniref:hypothetical protein n=1 Tax=Brevirhabdus sp. TaxID=2004514 RepID=UPI0040584660